MSEALVRDTHKILYTERDRVWPFVKASKLCGKDSL